jgi:tetrahydromethanopterin S-methyltransferase subunit B
MKNIYIYDPCKEDWSKMTPTERGAFCKKCSIDVIDFTQKTPGQVKEILRANDSNRMCGHFGSEQLEMLNSGDFTYWQGQTSRTFQSKFMMALILVFGLSLFSCSTEDRGKIADLNRAKTEMTFDVEAHSTVDDFAQTIQAARITNHLLEIPIPAEEEEIEWISVVSGGIGYESDWLKKDVIHTEVYTTTGVIRQESHQIVDITMTKQEIDELEETLFSDPILNEVDPFETRLFPNPTRDNAALLVFVKSTAQFDIQLYNMSGQLLREIHRGELQEGEQRFDIEMYDFEPGMYLTRIISGEQAETVKIQKL